MAAASQAVTPTRLSDFLQAATDAGLPEPAVFEDNLVWQTKKGRVTVYAEAGWYEVEWVPDGPISPYVTSDPSDAVARVGDALANMAS